MKNKELGIYVHIPFCQQKCFYCDFVSFGGNLQKCNQYIDAILCEIDSFDFSKYNVSTIYFGGGTPSYIDQENIQKIMQKILKKLEKQNNKDIEITIEVNPGTVDKEKLTTYFDMGFNRISIGLQTANDTLLKKIGRIHDYKQFIETYILAKEVGFKNINVDLMFALPNQTITDLKETIQKIIELDIQHISVYSLILEEGTILYDLVEKGKEKIVDEEIERNMYWYIKNILELHGFKHYEISNFAKNGFESKHNMHCWNQHEYIGFGIASHSFIKNIRYCNSDNMEEYLEKSKEFRKIQKEESNKLLEYKEVLENMTEIELQKEYIMLGFRKIKGFSINEFKAKFGCNPLFMFRHELSKLVDEELIEIDGDNIHLTNKGLDLANIVFEEFV